MRHHKYTPLEGEAMTIHNGDTQHHENHPCAVKIHVHPVSQLDAPFKQANSLARCNSVDNKGCKEAANSSDLR